MTRYLVTCGTSFKQSLCWNLEDLLPHDLDIWEQNDLKVLPLRQEVSRRIDVWLDEQPAVLEDRAQALFKTFIQVPPDQSWRYPAEVDTLKVMEQGGQFTYQEGDKVHLLHSDTDEGIIASMVLERIVNQLWPDLHVERRTIPRFDLREEGDYSEIFQNLRGIFAEWIEDQNAVLVVTGGYKLMAIAAAASSARAPVGAPVQVIYKFEEQNGLVEWKIDEEGEESLILSLIS